MPEVFPWVPGGHIASPEHREVGYGFDPEVDHAWHTFSHFERTSDAPTDPRTVAEFLRDVKKANAAGWNDGGSRQNHHPSGSGGVGHDGEARWVFFADCPCGSMYAVDAGCSNIDCAYHDVSVREVRDEGDTREFLVILKPESKEDSVMQVEKLVSTPPTSVERLRDSLDVLFHLRFAPTPEVLRALHGLPFVQEVFWDSEPI